MFYHILTKTTNGVSEITFKLFAWQSLEHDASILLNMYVSIQIFVSLFRRKILINLFDPIYNTCI